MAAITTNSEITHNTLASSFFAQLKDRAVKYYMYRKTIGELRKLSRLELADLGLSQGGIRATAYEAVYGSRS